MDRLPPVPTPAAQRWREFRVQTVPVITFFLLLSGVVSLWRNYVVPDTVVGYVEEAEIHGEESAMSPAPSVTSADNNPQHILGFVRQPIDQAPKVGDTVQVRTARFPHKVDFATIFDVKDRLEPINPTPATSSTQGDVEMGLPFLVSMPKNLALRPGERVDLVLHPKRPSE